MSWSYRVMRYKNRDGDYGYAFTEAYYDDEGKVDGWTDPVDVTTDTREEFVERVMRALSEPVIVPNEDETACTEEPALLGRAYADLCWEHDETVSDADVAAFDKVKALKLLNELAEKNEAERRSKENKQ